MPDCHHNLGLLTYARTNNTVCSLVFHCSVMATEGRRPGPDMEQEEAREQEKTLVQEAESKAVAFLLKSRVKARHQNMYDRYLHQLVVRV